MYYRKYAKRRRPAARRRRYAGSMRTTSRGTAAIGQLAVYANPFSTATTNPKIPDGKAYHSTGLRLQAVKEFVNNTTPTMDFLLFPGLNNGIIAANVVAANEVDRYMRYPSHYVTVPSDNPGDGLFVQNSETAIDKWRIVSQALKVTLINNSDENDGWWESSRVQLSSDEVFQLRATSDGNVVGSTSSATTLPGIDINRQLVENPTYVTGKLRDIHKHAFQLAPQGADHDFQELRSVIDASLTTADTKILDPNYDAIYLRIHARGGTTPTRLMLHVVSNQEVVYDEGSTLVRYHSETQMTPLFQTAKRRAVSTNSKSARRKLNVSS